MNKPSHVWRSKNPMDNVDKSLNRRVTTEEIKDIVSGIPALRELLIEALDENTVFFTEATNSLMYSSRFIRVDDKLKSDLKKEIKVLQTDSDDESLSRDRDNHEPGEFVPGKELLPSGSSSLNLDKKRRFAMSLATLASKPMKRKAIVKEGAIEVLISLSSNPDEIIQRCCSCAFSFLATEIFGRQHLIEEGAMEAIVSLTTSSSLHNQIVKNNCCRALCNMCFEKGFESKAIKDGILPAVMHVVAACPDMVDICLQILLNITSVADKYTRIEEVTDLLLQLSPFLANITHEISFLTILLNLSSLRNNQLRLVEDGCLRVVERVLKSPVLKLRSIAANIFGNFTTDSRSKNKLIEGNAIQTMLDIMQDEDEGIRTVAVKAFYNLARDQQFRQKMLHSDAVSVVIVMSSQNFSDIQFGRNVIKVLRLLCGEQNVVDKLIEEGIMNGLKKLLRKNDTVIRQYCVASICCLFQAEGVLAKLIDKGAIEVLIMLTSNEDDFVINEWCCYALYCLAMHEGCPPQILMKDIIPCLVRLCKTPSERVRYFCAAALAFISQIPSVDSSVAIETIVEMMKTATNPVMQSNCAVTLYNMAYDDDNCAIMLEAGALVHVVRLTQSESQSTKMKCAAILSRLSLHEKHYNQFAQHDVLRVLLSLCNVDHIMTQRRLVIAISNLSQNDDLRDELLQLKPVPFIISMAAKRDENLRRGCASIFCNLAYKEGSEKSLVSAGIVPSLLVTAMITSDQMQAKVICVKALVNLMADKSTFKLMAKEGVIWGLSSLALLDHFELSQMCAQALCSFSYEYSSDMLASPTSIKAVLQFIGLDETELQRAGARALANMLMKTTDAEVEFRKQAVDHMAFLSQNEDPEICEMCVICLCFASQSESCRELIVTSGMLTKIGGGNVFSDPKLSFAYLAMMENVANNASIRSLVLNDRPDLIMNRFVQIAEMNDNTLHLAVAKTIYSISCCHENIPKMANHNVLVLIKTLWEGGLTSVADVSASSGTTANRRKSVGRDEKSVIPMSLNYLLLACLYNLSTHPESQNKLVSQGFMELIMSMWEIAKKDKNICILACYSVYHMACGLTSTARLVATGCAPVLCFLWAAKEQNIPEYKGFAFPLDLQLRCAMAMRNMMCVVTNQQELVAAGCVDALVAIAQEAELHSTTPSTRGLSFKKRPVTLASPVTSATQSKMSLAIAMEVQIYEETRRHCASALRCLTFNKDLRENLSLRGAVKVLLDDLNADMKEESFPIDYNLLSQLEFESWANGSRSKGSKEGRAPPIPPAPLNLSLLSMTQKVALDVTVRSAVLQKYRVQVQLEEPRIEQGADQIDVLVEDISTLTMFDHAEDQGGISVTSQSEKKEWLALDIVQALNAGDWIDPAANMISRKSDDKRKSTGNLLLSTSEDVRDYYTISKSQSHVTISAADDIVLPIASHYGLPEVKHLRPIISDNDNRPAISRGNSVRADFVGALDLPQIPMTGINSGIGSQKSGKKGKIRVSTRKEEKFNNLVSFINHTRKSNGDIEGVLNKWSTFTK